MVVTNPPSYQLLVAWIALLKGATPLLSVHDLYPDKMFWCRLGLREKAVCYIVS